MVKTILLSTHSNLKASLRLNMHWTNRYLKWEYIRKAVKHQILILSIFPGRDGRLWYVRSSVCLDWMPWLTLSSSPVLPAPSPQTPLARGPGALSGQFSLGELWQHPDYWQSGSSPGNLPESHHHRCMCCCPSHPYSLPCSLYLEVRLNSDEKFRVTRNLFRENFV